MVFQHVAYEILGTLNPSLKDHGFRIRYINFERDPNQKPDLSRYSGLVILGGHMGVGDTELYPHLKTEFLLIEEALKKDIPVLGICLGSQMLAHVLGARVQRAPEKEIGWHTVSTTPLGTHDPLLKSFQPEEKIFQWHQDAFEIPKESNLLAQSNRCPHQAFRYGKHAYGFQFHLEVDRAMIHRWLRVPRNRKELEESGLDPAQIEIETDQYIHRSKELSSQVFSQFIELFPFEGRRISLGSGHGRTERR